MLTKLTFHELHSLGSSYDEERVTMALPFTVMSGVTIEDVSGWLNDESLRWVSSHLGIYQTEALKRVRFALVHRYTADSAITGTNEDIESEKLVRNLTELVHIIRPMRQRTSMARGRYNDDGTVKIDGMDTPEEIETPEVHKLNHLRDRDLIIVRRWHAFSNRQWKAMLRSSVQQSSTILSGELCNMQMLGTCFGARQSKPSTPHTDLSIRENW